MIKTLQCKMCLRIFEGWHNKEYCLKCYPKRKRQKERELESEKKGRPIHEGKWRCPTCGAFKYKSSEVCQTCSNKRRHGDKIPNWKGGRLKDGSGHIIIIKPEGYEYLKHRYVFEHIVIWEKVNGKIPKGWVIHHLNGIKDDNRIENLSALPRSAHSGSAVLNVFKERIRVLEEQIRVLQPTSCLK